MIFCASRTTNADALLKAAATAVRERTCYLASAVQFEMLFCGGGR
jgi:hypothetical protein